MTPQLPATPLHDGHIRQAIATITTEHNDELYDLLHQAYNRGLQDGYRQGAEKGKA